MVLKWYKKLVDKHPFRTQVFTAGLITSSADIIAQTITKSKNEQYDFKRTQVMGTLGLCFVGPINTIWFRYLRSTGLSPLKCVIADQTTTGPLLCAGFCFLHPFLSGRSINESFDHMTSTFPSVITTAWCLWTPTQTVNFMLIPFQMRVLFTQMVSLMWNTFLSYISNKR